MPVAVDIRGHKTERIGLRAQRVMLRRVEVAANVSPMSAMTNLLGGKERCMRVERCARECEHDDE